MPPRRGETRPARTLAASALVAAALLMGGPVFSSGETPQTYRVGPGQPFASLADVADRLAPGDTVEVEGGHVYAGTVTFRHHGRADAPITVRGIKKEGARPLLVPPGPEELGALVRFDGDHYRFEGFEVAGGSSQTLLRGLYNVADGVEIRDTLVRDCPANGIAGADRSGSLTLEGVEVRGCGKGTTAHAIYVGSCHERHPGALFRMRFCHIHSGTGGNLVKSRAARTEIYYSRIEGAAYFELDLVGGDPDAQPREADRRVKESADLFGNLIASREGSRGPVARLGSDGTGASEGRYRFAHNTILCSGKPGPVLQVRGAIAGLEFYNNAVIQPGGRGTFWQPPPGRARSTPLVGAGNWFSDSLAGIPEIFAGTTKGPDPGFDPADPFRPGPTSPLRDVAADLLRIDGFPVAGLYEPVPPGGGRPRREPSGAPDIGAFEGR